MIHISRVAHRHDMFACAQFMYMWPGPSFDFKHEAIKPRRALHVLYYIGRADVSCSMFRSSIRDTYSTVHLFTMHRNDLQLHASPEFAPAFTATLSLNSKLSQRQLKIKALPLKIYHGVTFNS